MLMNELKQRTASLHRQTETAFDLKHACASMPNYLAMLRAMLSLYRPLERRLDRVDFDAAHIDWPERRKTPLIEKDLCSIGDHETVSDDPAALNVPLHSVAAGIGCLYVLEGSTLGAQFITKQIERSLGLTASTGLAFFTGYGPQTREKWASFGAAADAYAGEDEVRIAEAIDAACWTFSAFEQALFASKRALGEVPQAAADARPTPGVSKPMPTPGRPANLAVPRRTPPREAKPVGGATPS